MVSLPYSKCLGEKNHIINPFTDNWSNSKRSSGISFFFFFSFISLTVGASRLMEAQMDLPRLLFGVGFLMDILV